MGKLATPGEGHKKLDFFAGAWQAIHSFWMEPGTPPAVSQGSSQHKWVLGGRFLEQRYEGTFMNLPYSGIGYTGYDNYQQKYLSNWMDTANTTIMSSTGSFDASGKVLSSSGKFHDPASGQVVTIRDKLTIVNPDEVLFEMWGPGPDGKEFRMIEIRYKRKK